MDVKKIFAAPKVMAVIGDANSGKTMTFSKYSG
jgi:polynucleotide 5'-kinase involved in rRNA processing